MATVTNGIAAWINLHRIPLETFRATRMDHGAPRGSRPDAGDGSVPRRKLAPQGVPPLRRCGYAVQRELSRA